MQNIPHISDAEWEVMSVLWTLGEATAGQVVEALEKKCNWHPKTIRTLLNRLVKKEALTFNSEGSVYLYRPTVTRDACVRQESRSFLEKVFGGAPSALLAHFVQEERLSQDEIASLRALLEQRGRLP